MKITLVMLAAGMGSRFGGLKQLESVGPSGETIIDYTIYDAVRAGFDKAVFVIRKSFEKEFTDRITKTFDEHIDIALAFQELENMPPGRVKPWGTAHALQCAAHAIPGHFAVLNCDDFYGTESFSILARECRGLSSKNAEGFIVGYPLKNTLSEHGPVSRALCQVTAEGTLSSMEEIKKIEKAGNTYIAKEPDRERKLKGDDMVSMNMFGFSFSFLPILQKEVREFLQEKGDSISEEFYIPTAVDRSIRKKALSMKVFPTTAQWFGMTYKEDLKWVKENIQNPVSYTHLTLPTN